MSPLCALTFRCFSSGGTPGTAFLLGQDYAVTAAHCIPESDNSTVILIVGGQSTRWRLIWRGTYPKVDGALLRLIEPLPPNAVNRKNSFSLGCLRNLHLVRDLNWSAFGYPTSDSESLGLDLNGTVAGIQSGQDFRRLQLTPRQASIDAKALKGASGGPVSINGHIVAVISRTPPAFAQSVVYACLLEDIFAEFFNFAEGSTDSDLKEDASAIQAQVGNLRAIELDRCDRLLNKYLGSLRKLDQAFHEGAIRTTRCLSGSLRSASLEATYVPATLHQITHVQDFWTEISPDSAAYGVCSPDRTQFAEFAEVLRKFADSQSRIELLVTGDAGAGKSTMLAYIAVKAYFRPTELGLSEPMLPLILKLPELAKLQSEGIFNFEDWISEARLQSLPFCVPIIDSSSSQERMFETFSERLGAQWLILLDGLEEVIEEHRNDLYSRFFRCVVDSPLNWILTSRPAASLSDPVIDISQSSGVSSYKILPWSEPELRRFASSILGPDSSKRFLGQFKRFVLESSTTTPLLTTIAICVYQQTRDALPSTKTELYDLFIENALLSALRRSGGAAPAWIRDIPATSLTLLMAQIAQHFVADHTCNTLPELECFVGELLEGAALANTFSADGRAKEFVRHVAAGSGLILIEIQDERQLWHWWHSTVRDYLAAWATAEGSIQQQRELLRNWAEAKWQEVLIFAMTMLSTKHRRNPKNHPDVTWMFDELIEQSAGQCGLLLYVCLAEGAAVDDVTERFVIGRLIEAAKLLGQHPECEEYSDELARKGRSPVELLQKLSDRVIACEGLREIADDNSVLPWMRDRAKRAHGSFLLNGS